jgi:hypothetical protein
MSGILARRIADQRGSRRRQPHHAFAADHAGKAGVSFFQNGLAHRQAGECFVILKDATVPVASWQTTGLLLARENIGSTVRSESIDVRRFEILGAPPPGQSAQASRIVPLRIHAASDNDRFHFLGSHDGAHAASTVGPVAMLITLA